MPSTFRILATGLTIAAKVTRASPLPSSVDSASNTTQATNSTNTNVDYTTSNTTSSSTNMQDRHTSVATLAVAIVVPLIIVVLVIMILVSFHRKLRGRSASQANFLRTGSRSTTDSAGNQAGRTADANAGFFARLLSSLSAAPNTSSSANQAQGQASTQTTNRQRRRRGARHNLNALQRSDSGRSVKTLPEYNLSLGESELMLFKAHDATIGEEEESNTINTPNMVERETLPSSAGDVRRHSSGRMTVITQTEEGVEREELVEAAHVGDEEDEREEDQEAADRRNANRVSLTSIAANGVSALRRSLRRSSNNDSSLDRAGEHASAGEDETDALTRQQLPSSPLSSLPTDATPTYDSIYPTISNESYMLSPITSVAPAEQRTATRQMPGAGAFRNIFRRQQGGFHNNRTNHQRFASAASVLSSTTTPERGDHISLSLSPTRASDAEASLAGSSMLNVRRLGTPLHTMANGSSTSLLPGNSTDSLRIGQSSGASERSRRLSIATTLSRPPTHNRNISAPLSIRHLQFEPPAAGFSVQQMAFLASVESLDKYGIAMQNRLGAEEGVVGDEVGNFDNGITANDANVKGAHLPSFEQLARQEEQLLYDNSSSSSAQRLARPAPTLTMSEMNARRERQEERQNQEQDQNQNQTETQDSSESQSAATNDVSIEELAPPVESQSTLDRRSIHA